MQAQLAILLIGLFGKTTLLVSSLDCNQCVDGLKILLDDHLSEGSVVGQTQVICQSRRRMIPDPQILTFELCASPASSNCAEDISYFWPLFARQLWPYLLDSRILCSHFCPSQR